MPKPEWLTLRYEHKDAFADVKQTLRSLELVTVCEESHCPNQTECWNTGTATFMILGDTCTRGCKFCNIKTATKGMPIDPEEPQKLLQAAQHLQLTYVVVTSVDRDELPDQGAQHFANCITLLKQNGILVEALIPDYQGNKECVNTILQTQPNVLAHNIETVQRLQPHVRDLRANYEQSLNVLNHAKKSGVYTKSSLMLGLGETSEEVFQTMQDLRACHVDILTLGQYLQPSKKHLTIKEYITPEQFKAYEKKAYELGFLHVIAGPFMRSSYKAGEFFMKYQDGVTI